MGAVAPGGLLGLGASWVAPEGIVDQFCIYRAKLSRSDLNLEPSGLPRNPDVHANPVESTLK